MKRMMGFALCALGAGLLALLVLSPWGGREQTALADLVPPGCNGGEAAPVGSLNVFLNSDKTGPLGDTQVVKGTNVYYQVGAGVATGTNPCAAFAVDVWIKLPGATAFTFVCTLAGPLLPGVAAQVCPAPLVKYTTRVADKTTNLKWLATLLARGNQHSAEDCTLTAAQKDPNLNPGPQPCFSAGGSNFVRQATQTPTPTLTPTVSPTPTTTATPPIKPTIKKVPNLVNLWLCNIRPLSVAPGCANKGSGVEEVNIPLRLNSPVGSREPKCPTPVPGAALCRFQTIGAFEFEVRYDSKLVSVEVQAGDLWRVPGPTVDHVKPALRTGVTCESIQRENSVNFRCVTKGKPANAPRGPGTLAILRVRATADVYSILIANQQNGIATQLINQDCQLADLQGHHIKIAADSCSDAAVTIRYLEGDVHADCVVNVLDQQQIAFRWGSRLGNLLYNSRLDLEPSAPKKGDGDIDAKDLQFVYGRHLSTCKVPHPDQVAVDPKFKPPVAP